MLTSLMLIFRETHAHGKLYSNMSTLIMLSSLFLTLVEPARGGLPDCVLDCRVREGRRSRGSKFFSLETQL